MSNNNIGYDTIHTLSHWSTEILTSLYNYIVLAGWLLLFPTGYIVLAVEPSLPLRRCRDLQQAQSGYSWFLLTDLLTDFH